MSYCVHCGVELDPSLKKCPLCNTPVLDPKGGTCPQKRRCHFCQRPASYDQYYLRYFKLAGLCPCSLVVACHWFLCGFMGDLHPFYLLPETLPLPCRFTGRAGDIFLSVSDLPPDRLYGLALLPWASDRLPVHGPV